MRLCKNCGTPLAPTKRSHAVYCTRVCKKNANYKVRVSDPKKKKDCLERAAKWRKKNKEQAKKSVTEWHKNNKDRSSYHKSKHRYRKMEATPPWITQQQLDDMSNLHGLCRKLEELCPVKYHVDHIVPLQGKDVCGLNVPWNLQILEARANIRKRNTKNRPFAKLGNAGSLYYDWETTCLRENL